MRKLRWVVATASIVAVIFSTWFVVGWDDEPTISIVTNVGTVLFAVFAAVCAGLAARSTTGRKRLAWACIGVGLTGWVGGSLMWSYYELVADVAPFPSLADAGFLMFPVGVCLGLAVYPVGRVGHSRARLVLDGVIAAAALFQISWVTVLRDVYEAGGTSTFSFALSLSYPIGDLVVITVAVLIQARTRSGQRRTLTLLTLGVIVMALSDSLFAYLTAHELYDYQVGRAVDVGYLAGLLVIGVAGLLAIREPVPERSAARVPPRWAVWLPYVPIVIAVAVCAPLNLRQPGMGALYVSTMLLVVAVLLRQYIVVAENRNLLELVAGQAMRDPLTGLANRALFNDRLAHAMQLHLRENRPVAVLSLDLDDFKLVNDNLGHPAGDALLVLVAERILGCVRTGDTVARLGGDEFAVLMEGRAENSRLVAHRVMAAFDESFVIDGHDLMLRPSVGLAVAAADDTEISGETLLKHADLAMYSAKRSRVGGVHTFDPGMHQVDPDGYGTAGEHMRSLGRTATSTVRLLGQLRHAIDHDGLSVVYQPKVALRDGSIVGVEALVRWPHPERGLLGPDQFLHLVREHGLMRSLTDAVIARALDDAADWQANGFRVPVAVNMFAPSLCDLSLPDRILRSLADRHLSPDVLTIEITEDLLLDSVDRTRAVLDRLRGHGIRIAIDDFGSGYARLGYLCELPTDEVKLDRQFIAPILIDQRAAAVVRSVIDLAHVLGMTTVAEGVENAATAGLLREYGCDVAQGFLYSRPVPASGLLEILPGVTLRAPVSARSS
jgi:diguanylate cyclase (GGDEF)-like protein